MRLLDRFATHFDLNRHAEAEDYFASEVSKGNEETLLEFKARRRTIRTSSLSPMKQITMYLGLFIGVLFSSAVMALQNNSPVAISYPLVTRLVLSAVVALVLTPIVYQKLNLDPDSPFIVQFGLFVQNGVFWQVVINSISRAF